MKLSELFKTPFKLKGGSTLNLRGFSKRVVDKEVGEGGGESGSGAIDKIIKTLFNPSILPYSSKVYESTKGLVDINDIDFLSTSDGYYLLYKKLEYINLINTDMINYKLLGSDTEVDIVYLFKSYLSVIYETTINGETYVALKEMD